MQATRQAPAPAARREDLLKEAGSHAEAAELAAASGDIESAARLILQSLDCERRAGSVGPQVLQLIKPRN
ncbi:MAG: hypothetical protein ACO3GW_01550 [Vulcanococcus sp.]|jgi:hypothetical protein